MQAHSMSLDRLAECEEALSKEIMEARFKEPRFNYADMEEVSRACEIRAFAYRRMAEAARQQEMAREPQPRLRT